MESNKCKDCKEKVGVHQLNDENLCKRCQLKEIDDRNKQKITLLSLF